MRSAPADLDLRDRDGYQAFAEIVKKSVAQLAARGPHA
jgi:hypothetical protein